MLVKALGNPEHAGRTRGVSGYATWKYGRDLSLEDKRDRKRQKQAEAYAVLKKQIMEELRLEFELEGRLALTEARDGLDRGRSSCGSRVIGNTLAVAFPFDSMQVNYQINYVSS